MDTSKISKRYPIILIVVSIFLSSCGANADQESATKLEEQTEVEAEDSEINPVPIETLPPIIKTAEVSDFLTAQLSSQDFRAFNSDSVKYPEDPTRLLIDAKRQETLKPEIVEVLNWGKVDKFLPEECEFYELVRGTTTRLVDSENIKGMLLSADDVARTNASWSKSKLTSYSHLITVWSDFDISKKAWDAKLGSYSICGNGYDILMIDGEVKNYDDANTEIYINNEKTVLLEYLNNKNTRTENFWIYILQGGIHHYYYFRTGYQIKQGSGYSFLNELLQKTIDEGSKTQSIENFQISLGTLETFDPDNFIFDKPNLGLGGSI